MPNHVTTELRAPEHVLRKLVRAATPEELRAGADPFVVDFALIIPQPEETDPIFTAPRHDYGNGIVGYGPGYSMLDWNTQNWGTKWGAYSVELSENTEMIRFDTAWAHPFPVLEALAATMDAGDTLEVKYADEDLGGNLGHYEFFINHRDNELEVTNLTALTGEYTPEDCDFATRLKYGQSYAEYSAGWED